MNNHTNGRSQTPTIRKPQTSEAGLIFREANLPGNPLPSRSSKPGRCGPHLTLVPFAIAVCLFLTNLYRAEAQTVCIPCLNFFLLYPSTAIVGPDKAGTSDVTLQLLIQIPHDLWDPAPLINFNGQSFTATTDLANASCGCTSNYQATIPGSAIFNAIPSGQSLATVPVFVTSSLQPGVQSTTAYFTITGTNVASTGTSSAVGGDSTQVSATGTTGTIDSTLTTAASDPNPVVVTVAAYGNSPTPTELAGNGYFDLLASGATANDSITVTFTLPGGSATSQLWYWNGLTGTSGNYVLVKDDAGNPIQPVPISGGVSFTATLDANSTPSIFGLSGTIFAAAPAPLTASPSNLWPPAHNMVPVSVDAPSGSSIISVTSNEPESGLGNGDLSPDSQITGQLTVNLRAERDGKGPGRIYTILVQLPDQTQNVAIVRVPHDKGG